VLQLEAEIAGLHQVIEAQDEQIALIGEEVETGRTLLDKGLGNKPRLLALQRQGADIRAQQAASRAASPGTSRRSASPACSCSPCTEEVRERVAEELSRVRTELATVRSILPSREDVLARTDRRRTARRDGRQPPGHAPRAAWCARASRCSTSCPSPPS
jgi:hypothetical protein